MTCDCACHNGPHYACSVPGGCGHLHRDAPLVDPFEDRRQVNGAAMDAARHRNRPEKRQEPAPEVPQRRPEPPEGACLTHRPPKPDRPWIRADKGYRTCPACYDRIHQWLSSIALDDDGRPDSIPGLYACLDARPGITEQGRRGPGFGTRSPASDHIISMRDPRSTRLAAGDPHSVPGVLASWCRMLAEERGLMPPGRSVLAMAQYLDAHLDWLTRQDWIGELHSELRELHTQLKTAAGEPRHIIGVCPNTLDEGEHTRTCGARLFAPLHGDSIGCYACGREWTRVEWLRLGDLLEAG